MRNEIKSHLLYYTFLILIFLLGLSLIVLFSSDKKIQLSIFVVTAFFYTCWGLLHHLIHHKLSTKIVVEYTLIASLGIIAVFFVLKAGIGL